VAVPRSAPRSADGQTQRRRSTGLASRRARRVSTRYVPLLDRLNRLKLELSRELPPLHDPPPVPLSHQTWCLRNRVCAILSWWSRGLSAYYSLWYICEVPYSRAVFIEPDPRNMKIGQHNAHINGLTDRIVFRGASVGRENIDEHELMSDSEDRAINLPTISRNRDAASLYPDQ